MNETSNKRIVIVGLFIVLGLGFLMAGILTVGNLHGTFQKKMSITTIFNDVNGLQPGNNVWFSGVKIGTVKKLQILSHSKVKVTLNIDRHVQPFIHHDSKVKISSDGFIGNKIVVIYGGTAMAEEIQEDDTLSVEQVLSTEEIMNTFQENNKNVLSITQDFKVISGKLAKGQGTIGKFLTDETVYNNMVNTTASLQNASAKAQTVAASLAEFSSKLNHKGGLANDLVTDTVVFRSMKTTILQLQRIADTAAVMANTLKRASNDPNSPVGVMLHDQTAGAQVRSLIKNLESSSAKLDEDLEAMQHNFLLRGYFKKKAKEEKK
jgi:phospholipid/cholesterol/gamma-HCH transport system substrate-binding protein